MVAITLVSKSVSYESLIASLVRSIFEQTGFGFGRESVSAQFGQDIDDEEQSSSDMRFVQANFTL